MGSLASTPQRNSVKDSFRFSWMNVLGQSTNSEMGQNAMAQVAEEEEAAEAAGRSNRAEGQPPRNTAHNPDVALRPQDDEMGVVMQGWLEKCGQQFKTWNWRFFVLRNDGVLSYYADETLKKLKGSMDIGYGSKADVSVQANAMEKKFVFMISTPQRNLMISAPSERMMTKWIARLHAAGAVPTQPWDPLRKTVKFYVRDTECNHEWKRYDDPTSYIHMEGCLLKRGHVNKNWKNRFFRIEKGELRYYTENQSELKGSVPLKDTIVSPGMAQCPDGRKYYFRADVQGRQVRDALERAERVIHASLDRGSARSADGTRQNGGQEGYGGGLGTRGQARRGDPTGQDWRALQAPGGH